jgi:hypothetical protein
VLISFRIHVRIIFDTKPRLLFIFIFQIWKPYLWNNIFPDLINIITSSRLTITFCSSTVSSSKLVWLQHISFVNVSDFNWKREHVAEDLIAFPSSFTLTLRQSLNIWRQFPFVPMLIFSFFTSSFTLQTCMGCHIIDIFFIIIYFQFSDDSWDRFLDLLILGHYNSHWLTSPKSEMTTTQRRR